VQALAGTFQHLSEVLRRLAEAEPSSLLGYLLAGMAFAHEWDAARVREAFDPSATPSQLPELANVSLAYEQLIKTMTLIGAPKAVPFDPEPEEALDIVELMATEPDLLGS